MSARASPWAWSGLTLLLAVSIYWRIFAALSLQLELFLFLPLLSGWLASRFGPRVAPLLMAIGLLSVFTAGTAIFQGLSMRLGIPVWIYASSVLTAIAFSRPRWSPAAAGLVGVRWRWLRWLLPIALWIAVFEDPGLSWRPADEWRIGLNPGLLLLVLTLAASVDWSHGAGALHRWLPSPTRALPAALVGLLALGVMVNVRWLSPDAWWLSFGFSSAYALVPVLAFVLAASRVLDWRVIVVALGLFFASGVALPWLGWTLESMWLAAFEIGEGADAGGAGYPGLPGAVRFDGTGLATAAAAGLLGVALGPFWRSQDPDSLPAGRTGLFLLLSLLVLLFGVRASFGHLGSAGMLVVGGIAFAIGLRWQVRGIVAGPLLIQILHLAAQYGTCFVLDCGPTTLELANVGLVAFPFAFFGLLSNRYRNVPGLRGVAAEAGTP